MNRTWSCKWRSFSIVLLMAAFTLALGQPALYAAVEYHEAIPFTDDFDSCTGERVQMTGVQQVVGRFTQDGSGKLHFGFTRSTRGSGVGQLSGALYRLTDAVHRTSIEGVPGTPLIYTEGYQSRLIRQGEGASSDDALLHFLTHITINANGEVTVLVEIMKAECK